MAQEDTDYLNELLESINPLFYSPNVQFMALIFRKNKQYAEIDITYQNEEPSYMTESSIDITWRKKLYDALLNHFGIKYDIFEEHTLFRLPCGGIVQFQLTPPQTYTSYKPQKQSFDESKASAEELLKSFFEGVIEDVDAIISFTKAPEIVVKNGFPVYSSETRNIEFGLDIYCAHSSARNMYTNLATPEVAPQETPPNQKRVWNESYSHQILNRIIRNKGNDPVWRVQNPKEVERCAAESLHNFLELISENLYWAFQKVIEDNDDPNHLYSNYALAEEKRAALIRFFQMFGKARTDIKKVQKFQNLFLEAVDALQKARTGDEHILTQSALLGREQGSIVQDGQMKTILKEMKKLRDMNIHITSVRKIAQLVMFNNEKIQDERQKKFYKQHAKFLNNNEKHRELVLPVGKEAQPDAIPFSISLAKYNNPVSYDAILTELNNSKLSSQKNLHLKEVAYLIEKIIHASFIWRLHNIMKDKVDIDRYYMKAMHWK